MRFIIADDVFYARKAVEKMVLEWDPQSQIVELCANGARVLTLLAQTAVDVLILDIRMPGADGLQLAQTVHAEYPTVKTILVTGYAEFEYAQKAIANGVFRYLLKPLKKEELVASLEGVQKLFGTEGREKQKQSEMQYVGNCFRMMRYLSGTEGAEPCALVPDEVLQKGYITAALYCKEIEYQALRKMIEQVFSKDVLLYGDMLRKGWWMLLLCNYEERPMAVFTKQVGEDLLKLSMETARAKGLVLMAGYGLPTVEPAEMPQCFAQAKSALNLRIAYPKERSFPYIRPLEPTKRPLSADELRLLRGKLMLGRLEGLEELLAQKLRSYPALTPDGLEQLYCDLLSLCLSMSLEKGDIQVPRKLDDFESKQQLLDYLESLLVPAKAAPNPQTDSLIEEMKAFLQSNYFCDLSLNELAATKYYMNPNYLSRLFKAETGVGFSKYLLSVRMRKAKELLLSTEMSVNEVAAMVGYVSTSYFIQNFKKCFGETPRMLREQEETNPQP
ncbi:MAG: helix-turn-helix domain-containing protein [Clostridia bacterium]